MSQTLLSKVKDWCYHSATVAWGYLKILLGTLLLVWHEVFDSVSDLMRDTDFKQALAAMNFPAYVGLGLIIIGFITYKARTRDKVVTPENTLVDADVPVQSN